MTSEFLLEAIGQMDDELVLEAAAPAKRYIPWKQAAGLAAAVLLCVGIAHMHDSPLKGAGAAAPENGAPQEESAVTDGGMGIVEPQFFTERGVYLVVAPLEQTPPPEGAKELGKLTAFRYDEQVYPAVRAKELVGCPVWESEDGEYLYVQQANGCWLTAKLYQ